MKTTTRHLTEKVFAAVVAVAATVLCLGSTLAGYEQVAAQAVAPSAVMVASSAE